MTLQEDDGLVFGTLSQAQVGSLGKVLGGLVGTSLLTAINTQARIGACVDGYDALGREGSNGQVGVVSARKC